MVLYSFSYELVVGLRWFRSNSWTIWCVGNLWFGVGVWIGIFIQIPNRLYLCFYRQLHLANLPKLTIEFLMVWFSLSSLSLSGSGSYKPLVWQQLCFQTLGLVSVWQNSFYSAAVGSIGPILGPFDVWQTYGLLFKSMVGFGCEMLWNSLHFILTVCIRFHTIWRVKAVIIASYYCLQPHNSFYSQQLCFCVFETLSNPWFTARNISFCQVVQNSSWTILFTLKLCFSLFCHIICGYSLDYIPDKCAE